MLLLFSLVIDSKCNYPAACNSMENLIIHRDLLGSELYQRMVALLRDNKVHCHCALRSHDDCYHWSRWCCTPVPSCALSCLSPYPPRGHYTVSMEHWSVQWSW